MSEPDVPPLNGSFDLKTAYAALIEGYIKRKLEQGNERHLEGERNGKQTTLQAAQRAA